MFVPPSFQSKLWTPGYTCLFMLLIRPSATESTSVQNVSSVWSEGLAAPFGQPASQWVCQTCHLLYWKQTVISGNWKHSSDAVRGPTGKLPSQREAQQLLFLKAAGMTVGVAVRTVTEWCNRSEGWVMVYWSPPVWRSLCHRPFKPEFIRNYLWWR